MYWEFSAVRNPPGTWKKKYLILLIASEQIVVNMNAVICMTENKSTPQTKTSSTIYLQSTGPDRVWLTGDLWSVYTIIKTTRILWNYFTKTKNVLNQSSATSRNTHNCGVVCQAFTHVVTYLHVTPIHLLQVPSRATAGDVTHRSLLCPL